MGVREKLERRIREKESEIQQLNLRLMEARAYMQAMQDTLRLLPREGSVAMDGEDAEVSVKPGTALASVVKYLKEQGKPMHIMEILPAIGREATAAERASIGGTLSAYVRRGHVFTRPGPNVFGLMEWQSGKLASEGPPPDFGVTS